MELEKTKEVWAILAEDADGTHVITEKVYFGIERNSYYFRPITFSSFIEAENFFHENVEVLHKLFPNSEFDVDLIKAFA